MLVADYEKIVLHFKSPSGTSRGVLTNKTSYLIRIFHRNAPHVVGTGECSLIPGLSPDEYPHYEEKLSSVCRNINSMHHSYHQQLLEWPSIRFGVETALRDLQQGGNGMLFDSPFARSRQGILMNGLIWMGDRRYMMRQIEEKLSQGFSCLKMKIGAIAIDEELDVLEHIRSRFPPQQLELRVDANGAFSPQDAPDLLRRLLTISIHSIEQPIKAGQWDAMAHLCSHTSVPIALDEELIGIYDVQQKKMMLQSIHPQYIILKPSLLGGWKASQEWIDLARTFGIGWWVTSALEANVGLNAIAQWTATLGNAMPQGLGTGSLYTNNLTSRLEVRGEHLWMNTNEDAL